MKDVPRLTSAPRITTAPREFPPAAATRPWRWSLGTLLLATSTMAVWFGVWQIRGQNARLHSDILTMRVLAHELIIDDPQQYAVLKQPQHWQGEHRWRIYLPPGRDYQINLASRDVDSAHFPEPAAQAALSPGEYEIEYRAEKEPEGPWRLDVFVEGAPAIQLKEEADWETSFSSTSSGGYSRHAQVPIDQPVVLMRMRFQPPENGSPPKDPANGTLLWIEAVD
jgi:hypothetical protein